tara:strand:- start:2548 stop:4035 length:1488 start_codon:yes stop_codon:yes gene_type:complete
MAFLSDSNRKASGVNPTQNRVDSGQIDKIKEFGFNVTPVSNDPSIMDLAIPASQELIPGVGVAGYVDGVGNFYVISNTGIVNKVDKVFTTPNNGGGATGGPIDGGGVVGPPNNGGGGGGTTRPIPTPPPPNPNIGSGKIYSRFDSGDVVPNQQDIVTRALWTGNVGNLTNFFTSSLQTVTQKRYYYEVFNSASSACGSEAQFSIAYGHKQGSGSADEGGQINDTPARAIYGQYRLLCLDGDTARFTIGGSTTDHIYAINVNRARMREYLDEGNLEINLAHLSGSEYTGVVNTYTGSNVGLGGTGRVLRLIDDSRTNSATITEQGEVYNMVSGSIEDGIYSPSSPHIFGQMYRRLGIIIMDANKLDATASFGSVTGSEVAGDNAYKMFTAMSGAAEYTDPSGDVLGFQGRSAEKVKSTHYFCRVKNAEYNFSNNPTYVTGSEGDLSEPTFINDPIVYITTVGLFNERKECVAVAKVSQAIQKSFTKEALIKVKLEF